MSPTCPCGHRWSEHTAAPTPGPVIALCTVPDCRCGVPHHLRLHIADLMATDPLVCVVGHDAARMPGLEPLQVDAGEHWFVFAVEDDRVLLESVGATIAVPDRELHLRFARPE